MDIKPFKNAYGQELLNRTLYQQQLYEQQKNIVDSTVSLQPFHPLQQQTFQFQGSIEPTRKNKTTFTSIPIPDFDMDMDMIDDISPQQPQAQQPHQFPQQPSNPFRQQPNQLSQQQPKQPPQFPHQQPPQFPQQQPNQFPQQQPNQFPHQQPNQFPQQQPNQFPQQQPNQFPQQQPSQFPPKQSQFHQQQPNQFHQQQPNQFPQQQPIQFPHQQPNQFPHQQPNQFPHQQPNQFPHQQPNQFPQQQPNQFPPKQSQFHQQQPNQLTQQAPAQFAQQYYSAKPQEMKPLLPPHQQQKPTQHMYQTIDSNRPQSQPLRPHFSPLTQTVIAPIAPIAPIDPIDPERQLLYQAFAIYFNDPTFVKTNEVTESYSLYYARVSCMLAEFRYLIVVTDQDNIPYGTTVSLSDLKWKSFQLRTLSKEIKAPEITYKKENNGVFDDDIQLVKRDKNENKVLYQCVHNPLVVELLPTKKGSVHDYPDKATLEAAMDTFQCVIYFS